MLTYSKGKKWLWANPFVSLLAFSFLVSQTIRGELNHLGGAVKYPTSLVQGSLLNVCGEHTAHIQQTDIYCSFCREHAQGHSSPLSPGT